MKTLVTGAKGFIGKNLVVALRRAGTEVAGIDVDSSSDGLLAGAVGANVVYHLAGVNRPEHEVEFQTGNVGSLEALFSAIDHCATTAPGAARPLIVLSSSTQAEQDNPYGRSKLAAEKALQDYSIRTGTPAVIYRLPGVFGKWCRPNYNSVVATFCHNIARGRPIAISDPNNGLELVYIDEVVAAFIMALSTPAQGIEFREVKPTFKLTLGELAKRIQSFKQSRQTLQVPDFANPFYKRLYATYLSYLEPEDLAYSLPVRADARGELAEFLKQPHFGQLFISRTRPGITRGNHYHHTKSEKFLVVEGEAVIRFRQIGGEDIIEHRVCGSDFKPVDIPPGYTHHIENVGAGDLITLFWASEMFDADKPDTYFESVDGETAV